MLGEGALTRGAPLQIDGQMNGVLAHIIPSRVPRNSCAGTGGI